jgi:hypothetical protein
VLYPQLFLGFGWIRAAVAKVFDGDWWTGEYLIDFLDRSEALRLPPYELFVDGVVRPMPAVIAVVVFTLQLVTGLALLANIRPITWTLVGMFMNVHFILAGSVNPSVFYVVLALVVVLATMRERLTASAAHKIAVRSSIMAVLVAFVCGPFITTVDPARVIEDPSLILILLSSLFALSCWILYGDLANEAGASPMSRLVPNTGQGRGPNRLITESRGPRRSARGNRSSIETDLQELRAASPAEIMEAMDRPVRRLPGKPTMTYHEDVDSGFSIRGTPPGAQGDEVGTSTRNVHNAPSIAGFQVEGLAEDPAASTIPIDTVTLNLYSVRCHFQIDVRHYEERITVWQAASFDEAIDQAEAEAENYAERVDGRYLGSCDCFHLADAGMQASQGAEIYSLIRASDLDADTYLRTFFFTGTERSAEV